MVRMREPEAGLETPVAWLRIVGVVTTSSTGSMVDSVTTCNRGEYDAVAEPWTKRA